MGCDLIVLSEYQSGYHANESPSRAGIDSEVSMKGSSEGCRLLSYIVLFLLDTRSDCLILCRRDGQLGSLDPALGGTASIG